MADQPKPEVMNDDDLDSAQGAGTAVGNPRNKIFDTRPGKGVIRDDTDLDIAKAPTGKGVISGGATKGEI
jgi:hypothetical protein